MPGRTGTPHIGSVTASRGRVMMIHPDSQAMLVRERSATLLAAAAAYRRGRQARTAAITASRAAAGGTAERGQVMLRDGSAVLIRPVRSTDAPLLADGFAR